MVGKIITSVVTSKTKENIVFPPNIIFFCNHRDFKEEEDDDMASREVH